MRGADRACGAQQRRHFADTARRLTLTVRWSGFYADARYMYIYSDPERENDPHALPDIEVWQDEDGWYWWACFPGCLPDGAEFGPFETFDEAVEDARSYNEV